MSRTTTRPAHSPLRGRGGARESCLRPRRPAAPAPSSSRVPWRNMAVGEANGDSRGSGAIGRSSVQLGRRGNWARTQLGGRAYWNCRSIWQLGKKRESRRCTADVVERLTSHRRRCEGSQGCERAVFLSIRIRIKTRTSETDGNRTALTARHIFFIVVAKRIGGSRH